MSYQGFIDEDYVGDVGTNGGIGLWGEWVDLLDAEKYGTLVHLREYGHAGPTADLLADLERALKEDPPKSRWVLSVAQNMASLLRGKEGEVFILSDGVAGGEEAQEMSTRAGPDPGGRAREAVRALYDAMERELRERLDAKKGPEPPLAK